MENVGMLSQSFWRRFIKMLMVLAVIIVVVLAVLFYCAWIDFKEYYLGVMRNLNSSETKAFMRSRISGTYDFIGLIEWTNDNLNWCDESFTRYSDPKRILSRGGVDVRSLLLFMLRLVWRVGMRRG